MGLPISKLDRKASAAFYIVVIEETTSWPSPPMAAIAAGHQPLLISSQLKLMSLLSVRAAMESPLLSIFLHLI